MSEATAPQGQIDDGDESQVGEFIRQATADAAAENPGIDPDAIVTKVLEKLTPNLNSLLDKRLGGFQASLQAEREEKQELAAKLREYEVAGLSEDERQTLAQQERDEEVERLRLENELYRLSEQHPRGASIYRQLLQPGLSAAQQVALLDELLATGAAPEGGGAAAASQTPAPTPKEDAVPVDRNNPAQSLPPDAEVLPNGEIMSDEVADRILATGRWEAP